MSKTEQNGLFAAEEFAPENDVIAAISTPCGVGGIAVVRISGPQALAVCAGMFRHGKGGKVLTKEDARRAVYGEILRQGEVIDDGIAVYFPAPHSYTGEDTVELSCHGGSLLQQLVLESAFLCGARQAGPGEFSKRAFENGKLPLSRAEAVIDLIEAESLAKVRYSGAAARGALSARIDAITQRLRGLLASTYAFIDYPDEDLTELTPAQLLRQCEEVRRELESLCTGYHQGRAVVQGIQTAIVGKPNTGKSTLLNALLGTDRAIVTPLAGTTRDVLQESAVVGELLLRLCDTAGIRQTEDAVERLGVERSLRAIEEAELILCVFDASRPLDAEDEAVLKKLAGASGKKAIAVWNKADLPRAVNAALPQGLFAREYTISAATGQGLAALEKGLEGLYLDGGCAPQDGILTNARQYAAAQKAKEAVQSAVAALQSGMTQDIAGMDLELALSALSEVDARGVSADITDAIFHRFCVGK